MSAKGLYRVRMINGYEYAVVEHRPSRKKPSQHGELSRAEYERRKLRPPFAQLPAKS